MTEQWVFPLDKGTDEMRPLLGGKGAALAQMRRLGIPTLPGFVLTTEAWRTHTPGSRALEPELWTAVKEALAELEEKTGTSFGGSIHPLVVSVRSSPLVSMPGQLRTVLNVGVNADVLEGLAEFSGDPGFGYSVLAVLIEMYGEAVHQIPRGRFRAAGEADSQRGPGEENAARGARQMRETVAAFLEVFRGEIGESFPQDPFLQLEHSIAAVFDSWFSEQAREYRSFHGITEEQGMAVVVQQMAFGNLGPRSGSGVVFSRNPATGARELYGEYLPRGQGEQLVGGLVTPQDLAELGRQQPEVYEQLEAICSRLEEYYHDLQDVEFTVQEGRLWILQTRPAKRTPVAALRVAVEMAKEGLISRAEALRRADPAIFEGRVGYAVAESPSADLLAGGIPCSPGAATGRVAFSRSQVEALRQRQLPVILVTRQTSADDAAIMPAVAGVLTQRGGATSHAAVVARGLGKPCVVGCEGMEIDEDQGVVRFGGVTIAQGEEISIDGASGRVFKGGTGPVTSRLVDSGELRALLSWADEASRLRVLVEANTPAEVDAFLGWGVEGVGLCRTERMYYDDAYLPVFRRALLGRSRAEMLTALRDLGQMHRQEWRALLRAARGHRLTVRLLNAPLDHFLPERDSLLTELAELRVLHRWNEEMARTEETLQAVDAWRQANPEWGLRGARLGLTLPELVETQVESLLAAAGDVEAQELPSEVVILIPCVTRAEEIERVLHLIRGVAQRVLPDATEPVTYRVGATIETPRAALVADEMASCVDLLCFDTDRLTDAVVALAREDAGKSLPARISGQAPGARLFSVLDAKGVGSLVRFAVERARQARAEIELGVWGCHGEDADALALYGEWGLDFVCCQAPHVLRARLIAGRAAVGH